MKSIFNIFLFCLLTFQISQAQFLADPKNTYVVLIGVLEWKDDLSPFDKKNRKDIEFEQYLISKGVPKNQIYSFFDSKATLANILSSIDNISNSSKKDIIFYYAGHGLNENETIYFANYDISLKNVKNSGFDISTISEKLEKSEAKNIWLFADCCYSGGLLKVCRKLGKAGKNVVALSSSTASNTSTGNWTYTQTLLDCLNGNPLADSNADGKIDLSELKKEIRFAMKYRERQLNGAEHTGIDETIVFSTVKGSTTIKNPKLGEYAWGKYENSWKPIRIVEINEDKYSCEFYFYSDKVYKTLSSAEIKPMHFIKFNENSEIEVEWKGKWYSATVKKVSGDFCYISYKNYDSSFDEWVLYERIRTGKEKKVEVKDGAKYYQAYILEEKNSKYFIHYEGWDNSWDEWIASDRIKQ